MISRIAWGTLPCLAIGSETLFPGDRGSFSKDRQRKLRNPRRSKTSGSSVCLSLNGQRKLFFPHHPTFILPQVGQQRSATQTPAANFIAHEKPTPRASPRTRQEAARRGRRQAPIGQCSSLAAVAPARRSAHPCGRTRPESISKSMRNPLPERPPGRVKKPPGQGVGKHRADNLCRRPPWRPPDAPPTRAGEPAPNPFLDP